MDTNAPNPNQTKRGKYETGKLRRPYDSLTDKGKRLRIARDVIAQVESMRIRPKQGTYISFTSVYDGDGRRIEVKNWARPVKEAEACTACALGSMFVSRCELTKPLVTIGQADRTPSEDMAAALSDVFSEQQLGLIEAAFEMCDNVRCEGVDSTTLHRAWDFCEDLKDPKERLVAIMKNIIDHDGTFVP